MVMFGVIVILGQVKLHKRSEPQGQALSIAMAASGVSQNDGAKAWRENRGLFSIVR
jgi:hypothetical protein